MNKRAGKGPVGAHGRGWRQGREELANPEKRAEPVVSSGLNWGGDSLPVGSLP